MPLNILIIKLKRFWRTYGTLNNIVIAIALVVAVSWVWGSISVMQTNFIAQKSVEMQKQELLLTKLQVDTLKYQQNYYKSDEYKELSARQNLGLVLPGERVLVLLPNSVGAIKKDEQANSNASDIGSKKTNPDSNLKQWFDFFSGKDARSLQ